jgi:hypothetical protein
MADILAPGWRAEVGFGAKAPAFGVCRPYEAAGALAGMFAPSRRDGT